MVWQLAYGGARLAYAGGRLAYAAARGGRALYRGSRYIRKAVKYGSTAAGAYGLGQAVMNTNRKRPRGAGSETKNKRRRIGRRNPPTESRAQTYNKWNLKYKKKGFPKNLKYLCPISCKEQNNTFGAISESGRQSVTELQTYLHTSQLINAWDDIAKTYNSSTSSWTSIPAVKDGFTSCKMHLKSMQTEIKIINQGPSTAEVDIYVFIHKNTTSSSKSTIQYWRQGIDDIDRDIINRVDTVSVGYGSKRARTDPNMKPFTSTDFKRQFYNAHHKKLSLETGREHVQKWNFDINRIIDMDYINDYDKLKGLTCEVVIFTRGALGDTNNDLTVGTVTYGPSKVVGVMNNKLRVGILSTQPKQWVAPAQFAQIAENDSLYNINDESGTITDIADKLRYG